MGWKALVFFFSTALPHWGGQPQNSILKSKPMPSPSIFQEQHQPGMRYPSQHFLFGVLKHHRSVISRSAMSPTLWGTFPHVASGCRWGKIVPERLHPITLPSNFILFYFIFPSDPFAEKPLGVLSRNLHGAQSRGGLRSMTPNQSQELLRYFLLAS